jgi:hypothetical protein
MLRTQGFFEGVPIGDKKVHSEIDTAVGTVSPELLAASALGLQKPYGEQTIGFAAGMIAQLKAETDGTIAVTISDGTQPEGIFADSYVDSLKSGKATYYSYFGDYFTDIFDATPAGGSFALNAPLLVITSGGAKGQLTNDVSKAAAVSVAKVVGHVIQIPDLANGILLGFRWQVESRQV